MSDHSANPPLPPSNAGWPIGPKPLDESWLPGPKPPREGWSRKKFFLVLGFVLALHVALIVLFGTKKQIVPRPVANVPHLGLANSANELIALSDPTLFARPNPRDLVTAFWRQMPAVSQPSFDRLEETPHYLPPAPGNFGAVFRNFMQSNHPEEFPLSFKPEPELTVPDVAFDVTMPRATTMQISGELARRRLLNTDLVAHLPSRPLNDVLKPTKVQVQVDMTGNVFSAVVLEQSGDNDSDQLALQLARRLRFAPAPGLTSGEITFTWHTVPLTNTP